MRRALAPIALLLFGARAVHGQQHVDTVALTRDIPRLIALAEVPAISIAVIQDGRVFWRGAFGTVNDSARTPADTLTVFEAASLSKPLFAYIVMRLADRQQFDLDRPLAELLEYPRLAHDPRYRHITARMVLSHGTGLPNWGRDTLTLRFDPGTGYQYSGEGFVYLQRTLERVTGLTLEELATREVFDPLGMTRSSYVWQDRFEGNAAYAKDWAWRVGPISRYTAANAAYSLVTTAGDYAKFVVAVLNGTGLSPKMWREHLSPVRPVHQPWRPDLDDAHIRYGHGWGIQDGRAGPAIFHSGYNGRRFRAWVQAYPSGKTGIVYLASGDEGDTFAAELVSRVVADEHWALQWQQTDRHDDPRRVALRFVQHAAVTDGVEGALDRYRAMRADPATRPAPSAAAHVIAFLKVRGSGAAERAIAEMTVADHPDSAQSHDLLALALLMEREYRAAIAAQRRSLVLRPENPQGSRLIQWIEQRMASLAQPVTVPYETLERYVGQYGERRVRLHDGRLFYQRGPEPEYLLTPITQDVFAVEGVESFRVQFVLDGPGPAARTLGIEVNGNVFGLQRTR